MLPKEYNWLASEPAPAVLIEMLKLYGVVETPGAGDNPTILAWAKELDLANEYKHDEVPWCGLTVGVAVKRAGLDPVKTPLWAKAWAQWGTAQKVPALGDILVFQRAGGGGHVGLYVGEDDKAMHVLGGNQGDRVSITRIDKARLFAIRRTAWRVGQPANVRRVILSPGGALSQNEA